MRTLLYELFVEPFLQVLRPPLGRRAHALPGRNEVPNAIRAGTIVIKRGTVFPQGLRFASKVVTPGWRILATLDGRGLGRQIDKGGWIFFYLAGELQATIFGSYGPETVRRAVKRILAMRKSERFNSLEVTHVARKRFLGVPYTRVTAHSRHIQESVFLFRAGALQIAA